MSRKAKEQRVACLVIIDHAQQIMKYQYKELTKYIEEQLRDKMKYGKIVILTRKQEPQGKKEALSYSRAFRHAKEPTNIENQ